MADSEDENFVTFGSALEPLDEENLPRKKAVTIEDQYALDPQGRRRFHGAFTGGFSAGYFNSVGTRDGWKPQQFKSSRSSKAGGVSQRVEDFMDEEDTGEFGIAPSAIRANTDFTDHGRKGLKRERQRQDNDGPIPGVPVLKELLKPVKDTVGVTLLKKMGWRPGQGIGPRLTKLEKTKTREKNEKMKVYGCSLPTQQDKTNSPSSEDDSDNDGEEILFAPDDYEPFLCNPKDNYFGIGYTGLDRRPVLSGHLNLFDGPAFKLQDNNKKLSIRGQAFGVGAFEADDEDIYQRDDMSRYDFALGPSSTKNQSRWSEKNNTPETSKENCLRGFVSAKNSLKTKKIFEPPKLPNEFKPRHVSRKSKFDSPVEGPVTLDGRRKGLARRDLNADDRAVLLGDLRTSSGQNNPPETSPNKNQDPSTSKLSQVSHNIISRTLNLYGRDKIEERKQLESQKTNDKPNWRDKLTSKSFVKGGIEGNDGAATGSLKTFRDFTTNIAQSHSNEFSRPFPTDAEKQKRFEKFVELTRNNEKEKLSTLQPLSMTEWEREHEREEFEQASRLFEKSSNVDEQTTMNKMTGEKYSNSSEMCEKFVAIGADETAPSARETLNEQMRNAARMKLFGKLTREREPWQPASLVCKRFNIPEPRTGRSQSSNQKSKNKRFSVFDSLDFGGSSGRFERSTDASGTLENSQNNDKPAETMRIDGNESMSRVFDVSDIEAGRSKVKIRSFEASYEKIFGRQRSPVESSSDKIVEADFQRQPDETIVEDSSSVIEPNLQKLGTKVNAVEKKDLFKAIFLSSSEDSEGDSENDDDDSEAVKSLLIGKAPGELNLQRNNSPPRGIFAKLDLDSLTRPEKIDDRLKTVGQSEKVKVEKSETIVVDDGNVDCSVLVEPKVELLPDMYGPVLPTKINRTPENRLIDVETSSSKNLESKTFFKSVVVAKVDDVGHTRDKIEGKWVERTKSKKSKKDKHKHKHKQKERSKHKHKKKDKR